MTDLKKDWTLNAEASRRFLNWLDEGADSRGEKYLEMRLTLVLYFGRGLRHPAFLECGTRRFALSDRNGLLPHA